MQGKVEFVPNGTNLHELGLKLLVKISGISGKKYEIWTKSNSIFLMFWAI